MNMPEEDNNDEESVPIQTNKKPKRQSKRSEIEEDEDTIPV